MSQVFITCPNTGKSVYVGLNMDWHQLEQFDPGVENLTVPKCRQCGQEHDIHKADMFLRADGGG